MTGRIPLAHGYGLQAARAENGAVWLGILRADGTPVAFFSPAHPPVLPQTIVRKVNAAVEYDRAMVERRGS